MQQKCHLIYPLCGCKSAPAVEPPPPPPPVQETEEEEDDDTVGPDGRTNAERREFLLEILEKSRQIKRRRQRENFALFFQEAWKAAKPGVKLEWGPHIQAVCDHLQWMAEDRERVKKDPLASLKVANLLINVPPRSLKTTILTYWTVWVWLRWPELIIMYLSKNPRVALNSARDARDLLVSKWFLQTHRPLAHTHDTKGQPVKCGEIVHVNGRPTFKPSDTEVTEDGWRCKKCLKEVGWKIRSDQNALSDLGNTAGGKRISRGLEGTITGEGCDVLVVDDPHDLRDSLDQIQKMIEGYDSAIANRLNDPRLAIRICIMQRVNIEDFAAHVLKQGWVHVRIPMEYESKPMCQCKTCLAGVNPFGWKDFRTVDGEVLHPRYTPEFLATERVRLQEFGYAAQMQQRPAIKGGGLIKKDYWGFFRLSGESAGDHPRPPGCNQDDETRVVERIKSGWNRGKWDFDWIVLSVDAANKKTTRGSNYGLLAIAGKDMRRFFLDDRTRRGTIDEILDVLRDMIVTWRPEKLIIEAKAAGPSLGSTLEKEIGNGAIRAHDRCQGKVQPVYHLDKHGNVEVRDDEKRISHWECVVCKAQARPPKNEAEAEAMRCTNEIDCHGMVYEKETKANGREARVWTCKRCEREVEGTPIMCEVSMVEVDGDKERRLDAVLPQISSRHCYVREGAEWAGAFVEEMAGFPTHPYNDRVDATSQVLEVYKDGDFYVL